MNLKWGLSFVFLLALLSAIGFGWIALLISEHRIAQFDSSITQFIQRFESPFWTTIMKTFTTIGSTPVVIILSCILLFFLYNVFHHRKELLLFLAVVAGSAIMNQILKDIFARARPDVHRLISIGGYSFPSGHSMMAFSFYGVLAFLLWRHIPTSIGRSLLILISVFMILSIGISRIYLGVHYPSDVIGGYLASGCWLALAVWFFQRYKERHQR